MSRVIIAGAGSHSGKTTIACGLLASFRHRGLRVSAYKTGPDYIDPQYLRQSGRCEAYNLDTWLMSEERTLELFARTSAESDIAIIEGAMALYDGGINSTAGIARLIGAPVILVINAQSIGESAAAVALGFREFSRDINLAGVILNFTGSSHHEMIISDELDRIGIKYLGSLRRNDTLKIPERYLGLVQVGETRYDFERARLAVESGIDIEAVMNIARSAPPLPEHKHSVRRQCACVRIGVARDEAFTFYYPESLEVLAKLGAEIIPFSPLHDETLPDAEGYIFGGGFPELFASGLSENMAMLEAVRKAAGLVPMLAECGGLMYLGRSLADREGRESMMAGVIPCRSVMTERPVIGYMEGRALRDNILCDEGDTLRGHEFHFSRAEWYANEFIPSELDTTPSRSDDHNALMPNERRNETSRTEGYAQRAGRYIPSPHIPITPDTGTSHTAGHASELIYPLRSHSFPNAFILTRRNTNTSHIDGYSFGNILASYLHINFFGNAGLAEKFLSCCIKPASTR